MSKLMKQPAGRPTFPAEGYYGLTGEIALHGAMISEGDPCGTLAGLLSYATAMAGRTTVLKIKTTEHPFAISTLLIGPSGNGRKGSAVEAVMPHLRAADPSFMRNCRLGPVASGEGLVAAVADPSIEQQMLGSLLGMAPFEGDESELPRWRGGRRVIFHDSEFSTGTMVAISNGTTAAKMRQCFDGDDLSNTTKKESLYATAPHVVFHGHTTPQSFAYKVNGLHAEGGTYNRYLIFDVYRQSIDADPDLPRGWESKANRLGKELGQRLGKLRVGWEEGLTHYVTMDARAKKLWKDSLYEEFSVADDGEPEVIQQFTTRAAPLCLRLGSFYAGVGGSYKMSREDLEAAAIPIRYSQATVRRNAVEFLNANSGETPKQREHRMRLQAELFTRGHAGMSRLEITGLFNRNLAATAIDDLLKRLDVADRKIPIPESRRPVEMYYLPEFAPAV